MSSTERRKMGGMGLTLWPYNPLVWALMDMAAVPLSTASVLEQRNIFSYVI